MLQKILGPPKFATSMSGQRSPLTSEMVPASGSRSTPGHEPRLQPEIVTADKMLTDGIRTS